MIVGDWKHCAGTLQDPLYRMIACGSAKTGLCRYDSSGLGRIDSGSVKLTLLAVCCEPRDFPLFAQRLAMFPDVPEAEATLNLMLPIA